MISDADAGNVYRYTYSDLAESWSLNETITQSASFGTAIARTDRIYAISQPTTSPAVYVYTINDSQVSDDFVAYQTISRPGTVSGEWGTKLALSGDNNWLYISAYDDNEVHVYRKQNIQLSPGYFTVGKTYVINQVGDTDFTALGAVENKVGIIFQSTGTGTAGQTGIATQINYEAAAIVDGTAIPLVSGDDFGRAISTDYYGDTLVVGAPYVNYSASIENWGKSYVYNRAVQNFEVTNTSLVQSYPLAWTASTLNAASTQIYASNQIGVNYDYTGYENYPIIFTGTNFGNTGLQSSKVYYINTVVSPTRITIKESRSSSTAVTLTAQSGLSFNGYLQVDPLYVSVNGTLVQDSNYAVIGSLFYYTGTVNAGDIINVSGSDFTLVQTLTTEETPRIGVQFGTSVDTNTHASEILIGAPFALSSTNQEGAVYRYTNGGGKYGIVIGTTDTNVTTTRKLLINGYVVEIPAGDATAAATAINAANITNIQAADQDGKLVISVIDVALTQANEKLLLTVVDTSTLSELGIDVYTMNMIRS